MYKRSLQCGAIAAMLALLSAACGSSSAALERTEALADDGGELGKAYGDLVAAFKAGDKVRAAALLDPLAWNLEDAKPRWFEQFVSGMEGNRPVGGRRQGGRATLFLVSPQPYYSTMNATLTAGGWVFDSPLAAGTSFFEAPRDCVASPTRFPCGALSAPDAEVSGHVQSNKPHAKQDPAYAAPRRIFDGIAVRMLGSNGASLTSIRLLLSGTGINPQMVALSSDFSAMTGPTAYPVLIIDVAPDFKSATLEYRDGFSSEKLDVSKQLEIDASTPNRIKGSFSANVAELARFDVAFDLSTVSECIDGAPRCGDE